MKTSDVENVYIRLLAELRNICREQEIPLFLLGAAALSAYRREEKLPEEEISVCVDARHAERLITAVRQSADPHMNAESMLDHNRFPGYEIRIYDPGTLDINPSDCIQYQHNCMYIRVRLIRHVSRFFGYLTRKEYQKYRRDCRSITDPARLFRRMSSRHVNSGKTVRIGNIRFPDDLFRQSQNVFLYGMSFQIPLDADAFFQTQYGYGWRYMRFSRQEDAENRFRDPELSWQHWQEMVSDDLLKRYEQDRKMYLSRRHQYMDAHRRVLRMYRIFDQSADKIMYKKMLTPHKDQLLQMQAEGKYEELREMLMPYLQALKQYYDMKLNLFFDDSIRDCVIALLYHDGEHDFAKGLQELIPAKGSQQVHFVNYRGELMDEAMEKLMKRNIW